LAIVNAQHFMELCMFPRIDSPCPLKSLQLPEQGNFNCSSCKREVHDLSAMDNTERQAFLSQCSGKVCVSYKVKASLKSLKQGAMAGLFMVSATGLALPVAAQVGDNLDESVEDMILVGGIKAPNKSKHSDKKDTHETKQINAEDTLKLIPVVDEDEEPRAKEAKK
jgi:predicted Fe-S protein YdhL (DUF1289 family)